MQALSIYLQWNAVQTTGKISCEDGRVLWTSFSFNCAQWLSHGKVAGWFSHNYSKNRKWNVNLRRSRRHVWHNVIRNLKTSFNKAWFCRRSLQTHKSLYFNWQWWKNKIANIYTIYRRAPFGGKLWPAPSTDPPMNIVLIVILLVNRWRCPTMASSIDTFCKL